MLEIGQLVRSLWNENKRFFLIFFSSNDLIEIPKSHDTFLSGCRRTKQIENGESMFSNHSQHFDLFIFSNQFKNDYGFELRLIKPKEIITKYERQEDEAKRAVERATKTWGHGPSPSRHNNL